MFKNIKAGKLIMQLTTVVQKTFQAGNLKKVILKGVLSTVT